MNRVRSIILFFLAIIAFAVVVFLSFRNFDVHSLLNKLNIENLSINFILGFLYFSTFGWVLAIVFRQHYKLPFSWGDVFILPFMMHLFTYLMPVKGGMLFQTFFMRMKYKMDLSKGFSAGIFVFLSSLIITSVGGLFISFQIEGSEQITMLLGLMLIGLLGIVSIGEFARKKQINGNGIIQRMLRFIQEVVIQLGALSKRPSLFFQVILLTAISAFVQALWFYQTAHILQFETTLLGMILSTLVFRILSLVRLLPGNLGLQELITSLVFLGAGLTIEQGLLIAIFNRIVSVALAGTIGFFGLYHNLRYFGTDGLKGVLKEIREN